MCPNEHNVVAANVDTCHSHSTSRNCYGIPSAPLLRASRVWNLWSRSATACVTAMYGDVPVTPRQQACAAVGIPNPDLIRIPERCASTTADQADQIYPEISMYSYISSQIWQVLPQRHKAAVSCGLRNGWICTSRVKNTEIRFVWKINW